jgi:dynein heavy chain
MELTYLLPPIHFRPVEGKKKTARGTYVCPVYYYPLRGGSRERPSFITSVELKSGAKDSDFYVKRGTAILTSLP